MSTLLKEFDSAHNEQAISNYTIERESINDVQHPDIQRLAEGGTLALRVKKYINKDVAKELAEKIQDNSALESYEAAPYINKLGKAIFETTDSFEELMEYYKMAQNGMDIIRRLVYPITPPIDSLRLFCQEIWPSGSNIENFHSMRMFVGLCRVFEKGSFAIPHQDMAQWDVPGSEAAASLRTQLAANVYLEPAEGGELELWSDGFKSQGEYKKHGEQGSYGLLRDRIEDSKVIIKPEPGELIIFNAQRIHAVREVTSGKRVTMSTFIGYRGTNKPLTFFS